MTVRSNHSSGSGRQFGHHGRCRGGVDRPPHQDHRGGLVGIVVLGHQGNRAQNRHGRLAHRDDVGLRAEVRQERHHVRNVVFQIEGAAGQRHRARVEPIGDVDVVLGQQRLDRAAQKRGVMTRHWRDNENRWMHLIGRTFEMDESAKRLGEHRDFPDRHSVTVDRGDGKAKSRFPEPPRRALEQFRPGGDGAAEARVRGRTEWILKGVRCGFRQHACRKQSRVLHVIETVKQNSLTYI